MITGLRVCMNRFHVLVFLCWMDLSSIVIELLFIGFNLNIRLGLIYRKLLMFLDFSKPVSLQSLNDIVS